MKGQPTQIGNNLNLICNMKNISIEKILDILVTNLLYQHKIELIENKHSGFTFYLFNFFFL